MALTPGRSLMMIDLSVTKSAGESMNTAGHIVIQNLNNASSKACH